MTIVHSGRVATPARSRDREQAGIEPVGPGIRSSRSGGSGDESGGPARKREAGTGAAPTRNGHKFAAHRATLKELYCKSRGCGEARFEEFALDETLYRRVRWLNRVLRPLMSGLFAGELRLMRALGECTDLREARAVYFSRRESARASSPPLHVLMRCRISGERLMRMAEELFELAGLPLK